MSYIKKHLMFGEVVAMETHLSGIVYIPALLVTALAAALYRRARLSSQAAGLGQVSFLQLEAADGHVCVVGREGLVIITLAEPRAHIGLIRGAMLQSVESLT